MKTQEVQSAIASGIERALPTIDKLDPLSRRNICKLTAKVSMEYIKAAFEAGKKHETMEDWAKAMEESDKKVISRLHYEEIANLLENLTQEDKERLTSVLKP